MTKLLLPGLLVLALSAGGRAAEAPAEPGANGLVVLLTDYGSADGYVGILKGAILSANPRARIFDATHDVPNFDVASASYLLGQIAPEWPAGTTFVTVVDPGVGTDRKLLAVRTPHDHKTYVGPDNGLLTDVLAAAGQWQARELTNTALRRPGPLSSTFHGRDWFGPVGGHLAGGVPFESVGPPVTELVTLDRPRPAWREGVLTGTILYVDHYGNLLTDIPAALADESGRRQGQTLELRVGEGNWRTVPWVRTYSDVARGELLLTTHNGQRGVEIAINYGHAAALLGAVAGQRLSLRVPKDG